LSKVLAEEITDFYCVRNKVSGLILRIPGIYGGNRKSGFIFSTLTKLYSNEDININTNVLGYWETIHVSDLSNLIINLINKYSWPNGCEVINISYGEETDIYETAKILKERINSKSEIILLDPIDYVRFYLSNYKLKQFINVPYNYNETLEL
jgi:nucleoside-diphosphate-sugar epimerase